MITSASAGHMDAVSLAAVADAAIKVRARLGADTEAVWHKGGGTTTGVGNALSISVNYRKQPSATASWESSYTYEGRTAIFRRVLALPGIRTEQQLEALQDELKDLSFKIYVSEPFFKEPEPPAEGSLWHHRNGLLFKVLMVVNEPNNAKYPQIVVYEGVHNGKRWGKSLATWYASMVKVTAPKEG